MRLTTNKDVSEMGMYELAHNGCYIKDGKARYRDFQSDIDARDFARKLIKTFTDEEVYFDDDNFDDEMLALLIDGTSTIKGLIALFYRNLWAMAELREKLKDYEDADEQGRLFKLAVSEEEEQNDGWIPCSERLPENDDDVLCWYEYRIMQGTHEGEMNWKFGIGYYNKYFKRWGGEVSCGRDYKVIAWRPLPEPYKENEEE